MHRGVREFIRWVQNEDNADLVKAERAATGREVLALEHQLGTPLPADIKIVLGIFDGASLPNGVLLSAQPGPGDTIEAALKELAQESDTSFLDPDLLLPFHRTEAGSYLAFDRTAAPVSDTWPVIDFDLETGEHRLIHRTFDGWCRLCVAEWTAADYGSEFTIEKYLMQGERHALIEPDVSIAHVTVAHALRRAGRPEDSLESYLRAGRCVPAIAWSDWEALKLAALLGLPPQALEASVRLGKRAPTFMWDERETTPSRVAYALATVAPAPGAEQEPWLRILDQLVSQALDEEDAAATGAIRQAVVTGQATIPRPYPPQDSELELDADLDVAWATCTEAYTQGLLREDDLLLDPRFAPLAERYRLVDLLRIRRGFGG